ncbi:MAG: efflux RND transporter permease subunit [bacterium]|nr:efflux RND transporter permease subunit [Gammaproteobacteria bacterium]MCP4049135.1 efflux RND transporter permease subunit [bacterium]
MQGMIKYLIEKPKVANLFVFFICLAGLFSLFRTHNSGYPNIDFGMINITTIYPGASPTDMELKITNKIEEKVKGIDGIKQITSGSLENLSQMMITMEDKADYDKVESDIQKAIDQIDDFPMDLPNRPSVISIETEKIPVAEIAITGKAPYKEKRKYALALAKKLEAEALIGNIEKIGYLKQEIKIKANQEKLEEKHISLFQLVNAIKQNNIRLPGGDLKESTQEKKIVVLAEFEKPVDIENVIVRSGFEGNRVLVKHVANVEDSFEDSKKITRLNGQDAINLLIIKKSDSDIIKTSRIVNEVLNNFKKILPEDISASFVVDYSQETKSLLRLVKSNAKAGFVLVVTALLLMLNWKVALWTSIGIPVSILSAFIFIPSFDITINFISLMAMIIVLGMLVDDAIVVSENIFRYREEGMPGKQAAVKGTQEVMWPVVATVMTTIVAFTPLIAMTGVMGKFMYSMPIVLSLILLGSLFESLFILPSHIAHTKIPPVKVKKFQVMKKIEQWYERAIVFTLKNKIKTLMFFIVIFALSILLLVTRMSFILFDSSDGLYGVIEFETDRGTSLQETANRAAKIEKVLLEHPKSEISNFLTTIGDSTADIESYGTEVEHAGVGNILIHLTPIESRDTNAKQIIASIKKKLEKITGFTKIEVREINDGPPVGRPVTVTVISNNNDLRSKLANDILMFLKTKKGVLNLENSEGKGKKQVQITFDYDLMGRLGVNPESVAQAIRIAYEGQVVTGFNRNDEEVDIRAELEDDHQISTEVLSKLTVPGPSGRLVPVGQFIKMNEVDDLLLINHYDGERSVTIYGDVDSKIITSQKINQEIKEKFAGIIAKMPDARLKFGGEEEDTNEAMKSLAIAMILALIGIYFILVMLFNSFFQPALVMSSIPFTLSGIIFAFYLHNLTFGFVAIIGLIGLTGVVVNNGLIMISFLNRKRKEKGMVIEDLAAAASKRLRPVLLTTMTTSAGLFPSAYGFGGDNAFLIPMIMAIAWGLVFASVITLFLTPALYFIHAKAEKNIQRKLVRTRRFFRYYATSCFTKT